MQIAYLFSFISSSVKSFPMFNRSSPLFTRNFTFFRNGHKFYDEKNNIGHEDEINISVANGAIRVSALNNGSYLIRWPFLFSLIPAFVQDCLLFISTVPVMFVKF